MGLEVWFHAERGWGMARDGARESGTATPSGLPRSPSGGLRHKGSWIRDGGSRKDLGPQKGQTTRPAPLGAPGHAPRPHPRGTQEPGRPASQRQKPRRRPPSLPSRWSPGRAATRRRPLPPPARAPGAQSPRPPRLAVGGTRGRVSPRRGGGSGSLGPGAPYRGPGGGGRRRRRAGCVANPGL